MIKMSVIIPVFNLDPGSLWYRLKSLNLAIDQFYNKKMDDQLEIIVIEQTTNKNIYYLDNVKDQKNLRKLVTQADNGVYSKSSTINMGIRFSRGKILAIAEPECFLDDILQNVVEIFEQKKYKWMQCYDSIRYLDQRATDTIHCLKKLSTKNIKPSSYSKQIPAPGGHEGGVVMFDKRFLISIGGFNEDLNGLGGYDNEVLYRARHRSKVNIAMSMGTCWHLWHKPKAINPRIKQNVEVCIETAKNPSAAIQKLIKSNNGNFKIIFRKYINRKPASKLMPVSPGVGAVCSSVVYESKEKK